MGQNGGTSNHVMQFVCSVNSKVVSALDAVTGKIEAGGDFRSFNNNWEPKELDALGIADEVGLRKGLCAWHLIENKSSLGSKHKSLMYVKNIFLLPTTLLLQLNLGLGSD